MTLKEMSQKYVAGQGKRCPMCGMDDIEAQGSEYVTTNTIRQHVFCPDCNGWWTEVYSLVRICHLRGDLHEEVATAQG